MKRILIISGSPRGINGNTGKLAQKIAEGVRLSGADALITDISKYEAKHYGCTGCMGCKQPGNGLKCVIHDDYSKLVGSLIEFDAIVIAAPVYFFGFPASVKAVIDRFFSLLNVVSPGHYTSPLSEKKFALVATAGGDLADSGVKNMVNFFEQLHHLIKTPIPEFLFEKHCSPELDICERADVMAKALALGKKLGA